MGIKGHNKEKASQSIIVRGESCTVLWMQQRERDPILLKGRRKICLGKVISEMALE